MIERTYLSKFSTIVKDSDINTGINVVGELVYGRHTSRILCYFDHTKIKSMVDNGVLPNMSKLKHILHITNAGSIDFTQLHTKEASSIGNGVKKRATSFDLLFFLIPQEWDRGKGFDYSKTAFNEDFYSTKNKHYASRLVSTDGSNWFQSKMDSSGRKTECTRLTPYQLNMTSTRQTKVAKSLSEGNILT